MAAGLNRYYTIPAGLSVHLLVLDFFPCAVQCSTTYSIPSFSLWTGILSMLRC